MSQFYESMPFIQNTKMDAFTDSMNRTKQILLCFGEKISITPKMYITLNLIILLLNGLAKSTKENKIISLIRIDFCGICLLC